MKMVPVINEYKLKKLGKERQVGFLKGFSFVCNRSLNGIIPFTKKLKKKYLQLSNDSKVVKDNFDRLFQCIDEFQRLLSDLIHFHKLRNNTLRINEQENDLRLLISRIVYLQRKIRLNDKSSLVKLNLTVSDNVPKTLFFDKYRLSQIFSNLLSNSIKYTNNGSINITIDYILMKRELILKIVDTGIGIPKNKLNELYKPFANINNVANVKSIGLGLSITHHLVKLMKGELTMNSEGVNKGTTAILKCKIDLKRDKRTNMMIKSGKEKQHFNFGCDNLSILIVEDGVDVDVFKYYIETKLSQTKVQYAKNSVETLKLISNKKNNEKFDVVFICIDLQNFNWIELVRQIRRSRKGSKLKIFGVTASVNEKSKSWWIVNKIDGILSKPLSFNLIERIIIKSTLRKRNSQNKLFRTYSLDSFILRRLCTDKVVVKKDDSELKKIIDKDVVIHAILYFSVLTCLMFFIPSLLPFVVLLLIDICFIEFVNSKVLEYFGLSYYRVIFNYIVISFSFFVVFGYKFEVYVATPNELLRLPIVFCSCLEKNKNGFIIIFLVCSLYLFSFSFFNWVTFNGLYNVVIGTVNNDCYTYSSILFEFTLVLSFVVSFNLFEDIEKRLEKSSEEVKNLSSETELYFQFLASNLHDMRDVLQGIQLYFSEFIETDVYNNDRNDEDMKDVTSVKKCINDIELSLNNIVWYYKIAKNKTGVNSSNVVELKSFLDDILTKQIKFGKNNSEVKRSGLGKKVYANIDENKFTLILSNIFSNILQYTTKRTIQFNFKIINTSWLNVYIESDCDSNLKNKKGNDENKADIVEDIVKKLCMLIKAEYKIKVDAKKTEISVRFPLSIIVDYQEKERLCQIKGIDESTERKKKVLYVDDSKLMKKLLAKYFKRLNYILDQDYFFCSNIQETSKTLKNQSSISPFDIVLLDYFLQDNITGVELFQKFLKYFNNNHHHTKVYIVTGNVDLDINQIKDIGIYEIINKPLKFKKLENLLK